jgi:DNA-directed RNA polymerase subunit RPC12/RpoP
MPSPTDFFIRIWKIPNSVNGILIKEENECFERSHNKFRQIAKDFIAVCPKCESKKITIRKRKIPKYRCHDCGNEFDDPKAKIVYRTPQQKEDYGRQYSNPDE